MRSDPSEGGDKARKSPAFEASAKKAMDLIRTSSGGEHSLSGHEPNRFFLNGAGQQFADLSGLSGMDHPGDGRSIVVWDYNHDGWQDIAVIHTNAPKLLLYRNALGDLLGKTGTARNFIALRFTGGNTQPTAAKLTSRDAYGLRVEMDLGGQRLVHELRCGEGFSAQNSRTLFLPLGAATKADSLRLTWPSGRKDQIPGPIPAGVLILGQEGQDPGQFVKQPYRP